MRAIEAGELTARRDNRNQWQVDAESLAQWASRGRAQSNAQSSPTLDRQLEAINLDPLVQTLRELIEVERRRADAAETDRDAWREMAQRSWWRRLVG